MPAPEFILFEAITSILFIVCAWHAARQRGLRLLELVTSLAFGVILEWMTIQQLTAYSYGTFLVMLDGAPLCIGMGWAVIIYSGMEFVKNFHMPDFARPFLVGILALNMDAAMDAIAIRLGYWHWVLPLNSQWYGVPWGNFWAWFVVVTSFSGLLYWLRSLGWHTAKRNWRKWVYAPLTLVGSLVILAIMNYVFVNLFGTNELASAVSMFLLIFLGGLAVFLARPHLLPIARLDPVIFAVPLTFHLFFNIMGFINDYYSELPVLGVVGLSMFAGGILLHLYPLRAQTRFTQETLHETRHFIP